MAVNFVKRNIADDVQVQYVGIGVAKPYSMMRLEIRMRKTERMECGRPNVQSAED
jgi:hypothetical protein